MTMSVPGALLQETNNLDFGKLQGARVIKTFLIVKTRINTAIVLLTDLQTFEFCQFSMQVPTDSASVRAVVPAK